MNLIELLKTYHKLHSIQIVNYEDLEGNKHKYALVMIRTTVDPNTSESLKITFYGITELKLEDNWQGNGFEIKSIKDRGLQDIKYEVFSNEMYNDINFLCQDYKVELIGDTQTEIMDPIL